MTKTTTPTLIERDQVEELRDAVTREQILLALPLTGPEATKLLIKLNEDYPYRAWDVLVRTKRVDLNDDGRWVEVQHGQ